MLAQFLRDISGYMERVGSGIRFMISEMRAMGLPDPEFNEHHDFVVMFRNGLPEDEHPELNERQQIGLKLIQEKGSISTSEYCAATGASESTGLRELRELVSQGLLVMRGKTRWARFYLAYLRISSPNLVILTRFGDEIRISDGGNGLRKAS